MAVIPHEQVPALDASYRTIRVLAEGPGGLTELVRGPQGQVLVRKRIPQELANVHAWMTLTRVESPLLPHIDSLYELNGDLVVVLSYVDGITLEELVGSTGPLGANEAVRYLCELCEAVGVLHANGIVHRDLSPGNVVVAGGSARIIDLGNARVHSEGAPRDTTTLGTLGFAAPEQYGFAQTDARSDVYALGRLLGYMLTGVRPDDASFEDALDDRSLVPAPLAQVVRMATVFEPSGRYQSAAEMADAAQEALRPREEAPRASATPKAPSYGLSNRQESEPTTARRFGQAPLSIKALAVATWVLFGAFVIVIVFTTMEAPHMEDPKWGLAQYLMSVETIVGSILISWHAYRMATLRGNYAHSMRLVRQYLGNCCKIAVIVFISMFLAAIIFPG